MQSWLTAVAGAAFTVATWVGIGAFIDFYIGKPGQQRVRGWLETWWLRLSYVRWGNFGREEALLAVQVLDLLFGKRLFSLRRLSAVATITSASFCIILSMCLLQDMPIWIHWKAFVALHILLYFIIIVFSVAASLSITRFAARRVASLVTKAPYLNFLGFAFLLVFQYFMIVWWSPTVVATHNLIAGIPLFHEIHLRYDGTYVEGSTWVASPPPKVLRSPLYYIGRLDLPISEIYNIFIVSDLFDFFKEVPGLIRQFKDFRWVVTLGFMEHLSGLTNLIPNLIRLLITVVFVSSVFLQTLQHPIMTLWARVIESDKPVFTLLFGGIAGFAEAGQRIAKILW